MNFSVTVRRLPDRTMSVQEMGYLTMSHAGLEVLDCWNLNLTPHHYRRLSTMVSESSKVLKHNRSVPIFSDQIQSPLLSLQKNFKRNEETTVGDGSSHRSIGHIATGSKEEAKDKSFSDSHHLE